MVHYLSTTDGNLEQISYGCITLSNILQKNYFLHTTYKILIYTCCAFVGLDNKSISKKFQSEIPTSTQKFKHPTSNGTTNLITLLVL